MALAYCFALKNLLPAALHASASTGGSCSFGEGALCGGGFGASPSVFSFVPVVVGNAPGVPRGVEEVSMSMGVRGSSVADMVGW